MGVPRSVGACWRPLTTTTLRKFRIMPPSLSDPTELPIEILEQILRHLPAQDIIKMESVWRTLADVRRTATDNFWLHD